MLSKIEKIEKEPRFKLFLIRVGLHSFTEYMQLFGRDMNKRKTAVERYLDTYKKTTWK